MNNPALDPKSDSALRAAYRALNLQRTITFDQAMADGAYACCIRCKALATARRLQQSGAAA